MVKFSRMWENIAQITCFSPIFKGLGLIVLGVAALLFANYMNKTWKEPKNKGFSVFVGLAVFIILFGLYILLFRPAFWSLPY